MVNIFVSIINYNGLENTLNCLESLDGVEVKGFKLSVVVVDNGSKDEFKKSEKYKNFDLKVIREEINSGFSGGQNRGIKYALEKDADYVLVLNNDVTLDKNLIVELLSTFSLEKDSGLVSPKIYFSKGSEFYKNRYVKEDLGNVIWYAGGKMDWKNIIGAHRGVDEVDKGQFNQLQATDFTSGCCVMIKKEVFESVGFFDEKYFLYYEDNDLSQRAARKSFGIYFQPKAKLWHMNASSAGGSGSDLQDYYITRNRFLFGFRYASKRVKAALFKESLRLAAKGRPWQKVGVKDFYLGRFGKGSFR